MIKNNLKFLCKPYMKTIPIRVKHSLLKTKCFITLGISLQEQRPNSGRGRINHSALQPFSCALYYRVGCG